MSRKLWNEGRVVGYSAYEMYVKRALAVDPETPVATEQEWLASSLAMGSSMVLRLPENSYATDTVQTDDGTLYTFECALPAESRLRAANTIIAAPFIGKALIKGLDYGTIHGIIDLDDGEGIWATKISQYGCGWKNSMNVGLLGTTTTAVTVGGQQAPTIDGEVIPIADLQRGDVVTYQPSGGAAAQYMWSNSGSAGHWTALNVAFTDIEYNMEGLDDFYPDVNYYRYTHIVDGSVMQHGKCDVQLRADQPPTADLIPDLSERPYVTISIFEPTSEESYGDPTLPPSLRDRNNLPLYILLTGFTDSSILMGESGLAGSINTAHPENGDFLGPGVFPWGAKIVFTTPSVITGSLDVQVRETTKLARDSHNRINIIEPKAFVSAAEQHVKIEDAAEIDSDWHSIEFNDIEMYSVTTDFPVVTPEGLPDPSDIGLGGYNDPALGLVLGPFAAPRPDAVPIWEMGSDNTIPYGWGGYPGNRFTSTAQPSPDTDPWRTHRFIGKTSERITYGGDEIPALYTELSMLAPAEGDYILCDTCWPCAWTIEYPTSDLDGTYADVTIRGTSNQVPFTSIKVGQIIYSLSNGLTKYVKVQDATTTYWRRVADPGIVSTANVIETMNYRPQLFEYRYDSGREIGWWQPVESSVSIHVPQFQHSVERRYTSSVSTSQVLGDCIPAIDSQGDWHGQLTDGGYEAPVINGIEVPTTALNEGDCVRYDGNNYIWNGSQWSQIDTDEVPINPAYIRIWGCIGLEPATVYGRIRWMIPQSKAVTGTVIMNDPDAVLPTEGE